MSLIHFHRFLIACGILFCFGFAAFEFADFLREKETWMLLISGVSAWAGFGLAYYLVKLRSILNLPVGD